VATRKQNQLKAAGFIRLRPMVHLTENHDGASELTMNVRGRTYILNETWRLSKSQQIAYVIVSV
jgi:hypothetical protein